MADVGDQELAEQGVALRVPVVDDAVLALEAALLRQIAAEQGILITIGADQHKLSLHLQQTSHAPVSGDDPRGGRGRDQPFSIRKFW